MRHLVRDRLHVVDRFNLDRALPTHERVERSEAEKKKDKQLAILWRLFQMGWLVAPLPHKVLRVLQDSPADPTAVTIVAALGVTLRTSVSVARAWDEFMTRCKNGTVQTADVARLPDDVVDDREFAKELEGIMNMHMTVSLYDTVVLDPLIKRTLALRAPDAIKNCVFNAVNRFNVPLLDHFRAREHEDPIVRAGMEHVRSKSIATIFVRYNDRTDVVEYLLKHFNLPEVTKSAMLTEVIEHMHERLIVMLVDAGVT